MQKKKRDHEKALLRRKVKITRAKQDQKTKIWQSWVKSYSADSEVMPMPSLADALSNRDIKKVSKAQGAIKSLLSSLNENILEAAKQNEIGIDLPENVVSFIIPLDFYMSLPDPYHAASISLNEGPAATCVTVFSDIVNLDTSAVKVSYLIASICSTVNGNIEKLKDKNIFNVYESAIRECNNVISAYQSISTRHNHYMHRITDLSVPQQVDAFIFKRSSGKIIDEKEVSFNGNVWSEIFQSRPLDNSELDQFTIAHINKTFKDDKIFDLISKYNDAINTRCFGRDDQSIILADSFAELALGYLYCESIIAAGSEREDAVKKYVELESLGDLIKELASIIGTSNTAFRRQVGFDNWYKYCRLVRNDLTHRFITDKINHDDSLNALHYSSQLISKVCQILQAKFPSGFYDGFYDKLELLSSAAYFVKVLHEGNEKSKAGNVQ
jgi:hypothetical protein